MDRCNEERRHMYKPDSKTGTLLSHQQIYNHEKRCSRMVGAPGQYIIGLDTFQLLVFDPIWAIQFVIHLQCSNQALGPYQNKTIRLVYQAFNRADVHIVTSLSLSSHSTVRRIIKNRIHPLFFLAMKRGHKKRSIIPIQWYFLFFHGPLRVYVAFL